VRIRRSTALLAAGAALALTAAACGGSSNDGGSTGGQQTRASGQIVYVESSDAFENLFPLITAGNITSVATQEIQILPRPYYIWPDLNYHADLNILAADPKSSTEAGKFTVTYQLNEKAVWSDGTPMSWKDYEYTYRIQKSNDPKKGGCAAILATTGYDQIDSVKAGDSDKQVVVTYAKPFVDWKSLFLPFFPQHLLDKGDAKKNCDYITKGWPTEEGFPNDISGGPWQLLKKNINQGTKTYVLTPNPKWWGPTTGLERLIYRNLGSDAGVLTKALQADEVQVIYPQPQLDLVTQVRNLQPKVTSSITFGLSFEHLDMNTRNVHLAKPEVRKAIATALDRKDLVSRTVGQFDSRATVLNNRFFVTNQTQYKDNANNLYDNADVDKAKTMLEGVGYKLGQDGIYAVGGQRLSLELMTTVNNKLRENTIDIITVQLKKAGIEVKKSLNPNIFGSAETDKHSLEGGKFDMALFAWVSSPTLAGNVSIYQGVKGDSQQQNYVWGNDTKVDELMGQMVVETDPTKAADLANQVDAQLWSNLFTLPLYQKPTFIGYNSKLATYNKETNKGIGDNASQDGPTFNSGTWTLRQ
jgi:peptide/nickel transport system substrate-binding protein